MKNDKQLISYYKRRLYKGRTMLARAVDFTALRLVMLCAGYIWFSSNLDNAFMAAALSLTATLTASVAAELIKSIRLERFIRKERQRLKEKLFRERLVQLSGDEFYALVRDYVLQHRDSFDPESLVCTVQSTAEVCEDDVLRVSRSARSRNVTKAALFCTSPVSAAASALASRLDGQELRFITPDMLTSNSNASMYPDDDSVDAAIIGELAREREQRRKRVTRPFESWRTGRYVFAAAGLLALSFFVEQPVYYRLLAGACMSLGATAWWLNNEPNRSLQ